MSEEAKTEEKTPVVQAITDLVETAYFLGLAGGSGSEVFRAGKVSSYPDLTTEFEERSKKLEELVTELEKGAEQ